MSKNAKRDMKKSTCGHSGKVSDSSEPIITASAKQMPAQISPCRNRLRFINLCFKQYINDKTEINSKTFFLFLELF